MGLAITLRPALKRRWLVVALALISACAFALSVQAGQWWTIADVSIGPFGSRSGFAGSGSLSWAGAGPSWQRFGVAAGAGGLVSMVVLLFLAGGVAARRVPKLAAKTTLASIVTSMGGAIGFVVALPDNGMPFEIGIGIPLFAIAILLGVLAAVGVLRTPSTTPPPAHAP